MFFSDVVVVGLFYFVTIWYCGVDIIWRRLFILLVIDEVIMVHINVDFGGGISNYSGIISIHYFDVTWLFF